MSLPEFALALLRLAAVLGLAGLAAHGVRRRGRGAAGPMDLLAGAVVAISVVLVGAEALGIASLLHTGPLIVLLAVVAAGAQGLGWRRGAAPAERPVAQPAPDSPTSGASGRPKRSGGLLWPAAAAAIAGTQWLLSSANAIGGGMFNFDTLWYHMPFAAGYAVGGSVTATHFTQADPWVAYYPANSELLHAIGIVTVHSDLLSPLLNVGWLAVLLLGAWCLGRPWQVQRETFVAGCLVAGLPVLAASQPGEAFNDIPGLAMLVAAAALLVGAAGDRRIVATAGLALGFAFGTKLTFLVPALVLAIGYPAVAPTGGRGRPLAQGRGLMLAQGRGRTLAALAAPFLLTGGWWYLRNLIAVGNPLGLRLHAGPLVLPGPSSPLAAPFQQTVASQLDHFSLWGSRFAPGLEQAFGLLWPLLLLAAATTLGWGVSRAPDRRVRLLALTASAAGVTYLVLPTGASDIHRSTMLFVVNLRYATPALALGALIAPVLLARRLRWLTPAMVGVLVITQGSLWSASPGRHLAFLVLSAGVVAVGLGAWRLRGGVRALPGLKRLSLVATTLACVGALGFVVQRHYMNRRYVVGRQSDPGLAAIYKWAQSTAHSRIALYGTLEQYPLYGAFVTNTVDYLGARTSDGGYRPISSCVRWRQILNRGHYRYLVLTPGPTSAVPPAWTATDLAARQILRPTPSDVVYELTRRLDPRRCA